MVKSRLVSHEMLSDLLELHNLGEAVTWPQGYSLEIAQKQLSVGKDTSPKSISAVSPVIVKKLVTPDVAIAGVLSSQSKPSEIRIYTDGSCPSNVGAASKQGAAGWGIVVLHAEEELDFHGPVVFDKDDTLFLGSTCGTNNTGELSAIGMALRWLIEVDRSNTRCTILYDSKYAANIAQGIYKAEKNQDLARIVQGFFKTVKAARPIVFQHVKGHSGDRWNDRADRNADRGAAGELQCWPRPATALYTPAKTLMSMFGKRPSPMTDTNKSGKKCRLDGLVVIEAGA
jgi:ribonuclease HI